MVDSRNSAAARKTALLHVYAAFGADPRRWPDAAARRLADDEAGDDADLAQGRIAAQRLDELLDAGSRPEVPAGAAARAVVAVLATERRETPPDGAVVVDLAARPQRKRSMSGFARFSGIAAMAASLVLGVYMGANGLTDGLISSSSVAASATSADYDIVEHVLADLQEDMG